MGLKPNRYDAVFLQCFDTVFEQRTGEIIMMAYRLFRDGGRQPCWILCGVALRRLTKYNCRYQLAL